MSKRIFFLKLSLILGPIFLILAFPVFVLVVTGEFTPPDAVLEKEQAGNVLYSPAYASFEEYYRMQGVLNAKPEVLALGNSRILDIRQQFFNPGVSFYDAGVLSKGIQEYLPVLSHIPKTDQPKVMIMVIEQSQFDYWNKDFLGYYNTEARLQKPNLFTYTLAVTIRMWPLVYRDYFQKRFSIRQILEEAKQKTKIGLTAIMYNEGYRKDGSYRNGRYIDRPNDPRNFDYGGFPGTFALIAQKKGYFRDDHDPGDGISEQALNETDTILKEAKARGIYVIAYIPPYAPTIYKALKQDPAYDYIFKIEDKVRPIFNKYGFELYNYADPATMKADNSEFFDGYHQGEKVYLKMFIDMAKHSSVLGKYTDVNRLEEDLNAPGVKNFDVYGD